MRKVLAIAWNDIQIEFSERSTLIFFLLLPVVFTTIIGLVLGNMYSSGDPNADLRQPVLVADLDGGPYAAKLITVLSTSTTIRPEVRPASEALALFEDQSFTALLTIPAGFGSSLQAGEPVGVILDVLPVGTTAVGVEQAVNAATQQVGAAAAIASRSVKMAEQSRSFDNETERQAYWETSYQQAEEALAHPPVAAETLNGQGQVESSIIPTGYEQSSPGQLVTWVLTTLLGGASMFVNERLGGTLRRLLTTPTRKSTLITGKVVGRLGLGLLQMALLVGFGALVLHVSWGKSPAALALILFCFGLTGTALGVALGAFARTRSQAAGLSVLFSMLLAALGGAWWPLEVTPPAYQSIVKLLPSTWAMIGFQDVITRGQGVDGVLLEAGILLAFAALFFALGVWKLRFE